MFKLAISLKRVQSFIFDVPRLKAMLGANALIGQTMRHELPQLLNGKGNSLTWPAGINYNVPNDPLPNIGNDDLDNPSALYQNGVLARDGGRFIAVFATEDAALAFRDNAEQKLAEMLPGVLYESRLEPFAAEPTSCMSAQELHEIQLLDLPVLQVCQETGREPASDPGKKVDWQAWSVSKRFEWGDKFRQGGTRDIVGLMRPALYPKTQGWKEPNDLAQLAAGDYLALIHADGNCIGKRYNEWKKEQSSSSKDKIETEAHGEAFYHSMRVVVRRAVVDALAKTFTVPAGVRPYEVLMLGGDDLLLMCRADRALDFASNYAGELAKYKLADGHPLHVAIGVAIAQQCYPLHRLHELAESLASSAKRLYRSLSPDCRDSVIDWQVVTQSWFEGIAEVRRQSERVVYTVGGQEETLLLTDRPCRVSGGNSLEGLLAAAGKLDGEGEKRAARSPLRSLRNACEQGRLAGEKAFVGLAKDVQGQLGWRQESNNELWKPVDVDGKKFYLTRALDVIGIREIARLGRKRND